MGCFANDDDDYDDDYRTSFEDHELKGTNVPPASGVRLSAMLLLPILQKLRVQRWDGLQWHSGHTKFCETRSFHS
jgi:hypothetical protein